MKGNMTESTKADCKYGVHHWEEMSTPFKDTRRQRCLHCNTQRVRYWQPTHNTWTEWETTKARQ